MNTTWLKKIKFLNFCCGLLLIISSGSVWAQSAPATYSIPTSIAVNHNSGATGCHAPGVTFPQISGMNLAIQGYCVNFACAAGVDQITPSISETYSGSGPYTIKLTGAVKDCSVGATYTTVQSFPAGSSCTYSNGKVTCNTPCSSAASACVAYGCNADGSCQASCPSSLNSQCLMSGVASCSNYGKIAACKPFTITLNQWSPPPGAPTDLNAYTYVLTVSNLFSTNLSIGSNTLSAAELVALNKASSATATLSCNYNGKNYCPLTKVFTISGASAEITPATQSCTTLAASCPITSGSCSFATGEEVDTCNPLTITVGAWTPLPTANLSAYQLSFGSALAATVAAPASGAASSYTFTASTNPSITAINKLTLPLTVGISCVGSGGANYCKGTPPQELRQSATTIPFAPTAVQCQSAKVNCAVTGLKSCVFNSSGEEIDTCNPLTVTVDAWAPPAGVSVASYGLALDNGAPLALSPAAAPTTSASSYTLNLAMPQPTSSLTGTLYCLNSAKTQNFCPNTEAEIPSNTATITMTPNALGCPTGPTTCPLSGVLSCSFNSSNEEVDVCNPISIAVNSWAPPSGVGIATYDLDFNNGITATDISASTSAVTTKTFNASTVPTANQVNQAKEVAVQCYDGQDNNYCSDATVSLSKSATTSITPAQYPVSNCSSICALTGVSYCYQNASGDTAASCNPLHVNIGAWTWPAGANIANYLLNFGSLPTVKVAAPSASGIAQTYSITLPMPQTAPLAVGLSCVDSSGKTNFCPNTATTIPANTSSVSLTPSSLGCSTGATTCPISGLKSCSFNAEGEEIDVCNDVSVTFSPFTAVSGISSYGLNFGNGLEVSGLSTSTTPITATFTSTSKPLTANQINQATAVNVQCFDAKNNNYCAPTATPLNKGASGSTTTINTTAYPASNCSSSCPVTGLSVCYQNTAGDTAAVCNSQTVTVAQGSCNSLPSGTAISLNIPGYQPIAINSFPFTQTWTNPPQQSGTVSVDCSVGQTSGYCSGSAANSKSVNISCSTGSTQMALGSSCNAQPSFYSDSTCQNLLTIGSQYWWTGNIANFAGGVSSFYTGGGSYLCSPQQTVNAANTINCSTLTMPADTANTCSSGMPQLYSDAACTKPLTGYTVGSNAFGFAASAAGSTIYSGSNASDGIYYSCKPVTVSNGKSVTCAPPIVATYNTDGSCNLASGAPGIYSQKLNQAITAANAYPAPSEFISKQNQAVTFFNLPVGDLVLTTGNNYLGSSWLTQLPQSPLNCYEGYQFVTQAALNSGKTTANCPYSAQVGGVHVYTDSTCSPQSEITKVNQWYADWSVKGQYDAGISAAYVGAAVYTSAGSGTYCTPAGNLSGGGPLLCPAPIANMTFDTSCNNGAGVGLYAAPSTGCPTGPISFSEFGNSYASSPKLTPLVSGTDYTVTPNEEGQNFIQFAQKWSGQAICTGPSTQALYNGAQNTVTASGTLSCGVQQYQYNFPAGSACAAMQSSTPGKLGLYAGAGCTGSVMSTTGEPLGGGFPIFVPANSGIIGKSYSVGYAPNGANVTCISPSATLPTTTTGGEIACPTANVPVAFATNATAQNLRVFLGKSCTGQQLPQSLISGQGPGGTLTSIGANTLKVSLIPGTTVSLDCNGPGQDDDGCQCTTTTVPSTVAAAESSSLAMNSIEQTVAFPSGTACGASYGSSQWVWNTVRTQAQGQANASLPNIAQPISALFTSAYSGASGLFTASNNTYIRVLPGGTLQGTVNSATAVGNYSYPSTSIVDGQTLPAIPSSVCNAKVSLPIAYATNARQNNVRVFAGQGCTGTPLAAAVSGQGPSGLSVNVVTGTPISLDCNASGNQVGNGCQCTYNANPQAGTTLALNSMDTTMTLDSSCQPCGPSSTPQVYGAPGCPSSSAIGGTPQNGAASLPNLPNGSYVGTANGGPGFGCLTQTVTDGQSIKCAGLPSPPAGQISISCPGCGANVTNIFFAYYGSNACPYDPYNGNYNASFNPSSCLTSVPSTVATCFNNNGFGANVYASTSSGSSIGPSAHIGAYSTVISLS